MTDSLRFDPGQITVAKGEVVTFRIVNTGKMLHEFTIGGPDAQDLHEAEMAQMSMDAEMGNMAGGSDSGMTGMPGMNHGKMPNDAGHKKYMKLLAKRISTLKRSVAASASVHVPPGQSRDVTWAFTGDKSPGYGCHVTRHWSAGMRGTIVVS